MQKVKLGVTRMGQPGLFTGNYLACPVSMNDYCRAVADRKFAEELAAKNMFELEPAKWMVMSAIEYDKCRNSKRLWETNAVDIATREEAERIADERTAEEHAAGHSNVTWYAMEQM